MIYYFLILMIVIFSGCSENEDKYRNTNTDTNKKSTNVLRDRRNMLGRAIMFSIINIPKENLKLVKVDTVPMDSMAKHTVMKTWKQTERSKTYVKVWYKQDTANKISIMTNGRQEVIELVGSTTRDLLPTYLVVSASLKRGKTVLLFDLAGKVKVEDRNTEYRKFRLTRTGDFLYCSYDVQ